MRAVYPVEFSRKTVEDDERRWVPVFAETAEQAERLCQNAFGGEGFAGFKARGPMQWPVAGPSRVLEASDACW